MRYNGGYVAATPLTGGLAFLSGAIREGPDVLLISAAAVIAFWIAMLLAKKRPDARLTLVCIWFLCGLIETVAGKRYFIHTRIVLFAPAAVLAAIAWSALQDAVERCRPDVRRGWIAAALVLLLAVTGLRGSTSASAAPCRSGRTACAGRACLPNRPSARSRTRSSSPDAG